MTPTGQAARPAPFFIPAVGFCMDADRLDLVSPPGQTAEVRARRLYRQCFATTPRAAARAPGRVNIIGDHTDYNGGPVLPMAISRDCCAVAGSSDDGLWRVLSEAESTELCLAPRDLVLIARGMAQHGLPQGDWRRYVLGVLAGITISMSGGGETAVPQHVSIASDVPIGAGLSSSAALELAVYTAVSITAQRPWEPAEAARTCREAEHRYAEVPCGSMDQLVCACAREGNALLIEGGEPPVTRHVPLPSDAALLVINTHVRHALAGGEYAARVMATARAAATLGVKWLCDAQPASLIAVGGPLTPEEARLASHCTSEAARVRRAVSALEQGDLSLLGRLMTESHTSLRDNYRVSCPELNAAVDAALDSPGVLGARMTGGGFGGCAIALVRRQDVPHAGPRIAQGYSRRVGAPPGMFLAVSSRGASLQAL